LSRDGSMVLINGVLTTFLHPSSFWDICCGRKWKFLLSRPSLHSWAINRLNPCLREFRRIKKHYARIHKPQFRFPMKNRKPPYCLPEDKAQVQFKAMYQLGHGEIRYQQLLTNGSLWKLTSLSTPSSQLAWIDLTILFFSLPVASSNKFPEFPTPPECHIFQRTCSAVIHDEVDMLTSSIVNDNAPCLIFSEIFQAACQRLWKASHTCIILALQWPWKLLLRLAHQLFWVFHPWALQALYFLNPNFAFSDLVLAC